MKKTALYIFLSLVFISLLTPFWVFKDLMFPYITSKAFFFRICIELAIPLYTYLVISDKNLRPNLKNPLNILVFVFFLISLIASLFGINVGRSLWGNFERMGGTYYLAHLCLLVFYIQLIGQAGQKYLEWFLKAFIGVAALVTLNGMSGWIGGPTVVMDPSLPDRVSSTFGNPIFFASYLIVPMFLAAYFAVDSESLAARYWYWILSFLLLVGIYSSATRGSMVGLVVGVFAAAVVYVFATENKKARQYGLGALVAIVLVVSALFSIRSHLPQGSTLYRLVNLRDSNTEARLIQWSMALEGAKDHPLLGVGPENYYRISDQYYNPELYKYDPSWFDKPHNFLLEVLVTTGVFGLVAYLAIFCLSLFALWKAFKAGLIGIWSLCLFVAALVTYQVQNMFVFDTVSASTAFYIITGFCAYLWEESGRGKKRQGTEEKVWMIVVFAVTSVIVLYVMYISNFVSLMAAKRVNYGYAWGAVDPQKAANYFASALDLDFNLDKRETAARFSSYATNLAISGKTDQLTKDEVKKATEYQRQIAERVGNDTLVWINLANDELFNSVLQGTPISSKNEEAIDRAIELAPNRVEVWQFLVQLYGYTKDFPKAVEAGRKIVELNPYRPDLKWQLAMALYLNQNVDEAVKVADQAVSEGYTFKALREFAWYVQYKQQQKKYPEVVKLLEKAVELEPNEIGLFSDLARAYYNIGDYPHARILAEKVIQSSPQLAPAMQELIASIK